MEFPLGTQIKPASASGAVCSVGLIHGCTSTCNGKMSASPSTAICMLGGWRGWWVAESTTLACTTRTTMSSPARLTWVPLFDSRSDRCSRPRPRARAVALLSPFSVRASVGDLSTPRPSEVERPTRRSVCSCARVKRRYQACWLAMVLSGLV